MRNLIVNSNISNEDLWMQSITVSTQYKNKHSPGLLQSLADKINLRLTHTYGTAGHGKGATDAMPSLGVRIF